MGTRKEAVLPFVTTWLDLEQVMVSEISQKDKCCTVSLKCGI